MGLPMQRAPGIMGPPPQIVQGCDRATDADSVGDDVPPAQRAPGMMGPPTQRAPECDRVTSVESAGDNEDQQRIERWGKMGPRRREHRDKDMMIEALARRALGYIMSAHRC
jgi:hypothetical protein